jgi:membrane fusion protein, multidrug efflux system
MKFANCLVIAVFMALSACSPSVPETVTEPVALVTTARAVRGDMSDIVTGFGTVEFDPASLHILNAEIEARVLDHNVRPGDRITQGQVVLRLGPSTAASVEIVRARREANAAEAIAERTKRLRADGLASDADIEAALSAARNRTALAVSLEARVSLMRELRSPIDGIVDAILVKPGDLVVPGAIMVRLASPGAIQVRIGIEIEDAARLRSGAVVLLWPLDDRGIEIHAVIRIIDTRIDPSTRMAAALVTIPPGAGVLPGEAVRAGIIADNKSGVIIAPRQSVFSDETGEYVYVVDNNVAVLHRVRTGLTSADETEIISGVEVGSILIVEGAGILSDGMKVRTAFNPNDATRESNP